MYCYPVLKNSMLSYDCNAVCVYLSLCIKCINLFNGPIIYSVWWDCWNYPFPTCKRFCSRRLLKILQQWWAIFYICPYFLNSCQLLFFYMQKGLIFFALMCSKWSSAGVSCVGEVNACLCMLRPFHDIIHYFRCSKIGKACPKMKLLSNI